MPKMLFDLTVSQEMLCGILADHEPEVRKWIAQKVIDEVWGEEIFSLAQANGVTSLVAHTLIDSFGENNVPPHWREVHEDTSRRISSYLAELDRIASLLADQGITSIIIENGALARAVYKCPGCYNFNDLDLLVKKKYIPDIHQLLTSIGYTTKDNTSYPKTSYNLRNGRAEYVRTLTEGYSLRVNFQWSLVARQWFNPTQEPHIENLIQRSVAIPESSARMLCPEDNLFQLAIHNSSHAYIRQPGILLHLDIDRFVRRTSIDWHRFVGLVKHFNVKTAVFFSLSIPNELFGTPVPPEVLNTIRPRRLSEKFINYYLKEKDIFNFEEHKINRLGLIVFTILLYDNLKDLWRGIFPDKHWMLQTYGMSSKRLLIFAYLKRLLNIAFGH